MAGSNRPSKVPAGPDWIHEIKYDGYRLRVERNGDRVRLITRNGYDWTQRYPWIVIQLAKSIIGGAMIAGQWISACVRPIVAEHSRRAKGIIMAVHRGEVVIFVLEHEAGVEECAVARDTLLDLARRHRADVSLDELLDIFDAHRKKIEAAALRKFRKGDYDVGGVLVTSADLGPHV